MVEPDETAIEVPALSLVLLIGAAGAGKTWLAGRLFRPAEVVSLEACRAIVADDPDDDDPRGDPVGLIRAIVERRLARGRLAAVDAPLLTQPSRAPFVQLARRAHVEVVAVVLDTPLAVLEERRTSRAAGTVPGLGLLSEQHRLVRRAVAPGALAKEGIARAAVLGQAEAARARLVRRPLACDRRDERGPFDVIGDVHGCREELERLLERLGWRKDAGGVPRHPDNRKVVFVGDLVDRGPDVPGTVELALAMIESGVAFAVPGNHEWKLARKLRGQGRPEVPEGLRRSLEQLDALGPARARFVERFLAFYDGLPSHLLLDDGRLAVVHGGIKPGMVGRDDRAVRDMCLFGATDGEMDEHGLPVRLDWPSAHSAPPAIVYGHTPVREASWKNETIDVDEGCVFGGHLAALRWPEREVVRVAAARVYLEHPHQFRDPGRA